MKGVLTFPRKYVIMNAVRQTERLTVNFITGAYCLNKYNTPEIVR